MVRAEHPGPGLQDGTVFGLSLFWPYQLAQEIGEVAAAGQGVGVVSTNGRIACFRLISLSPCVLC